MDLWKEDANYHVERIIVQRWGGIIMDNNKKDHQNKVLNDQIQRTMRDSTFSSHEM